MSAVPRLLASPRRALAVLLECQRMARARGRAFSVQSLPTKLTELAGLYGVDGLLQSG